jgi:hypothetical protein
MYSRMSWEATCGLMRRGAQHGGGRLIRPKPIGEHDPQPTPAPGRRGTMTHDYKRNGTTTLFAALNMLDDTVIGECMPRHRHREFLRFLKTIDERTLPTLDLHLIVDNYATHKTPAVKRWLMRHSRFHLHFTPTCRAILGEI